MNRADVKKKVGHGLITYCGKDEPMSISQDSHTHTLGVYDIISNNQSRPQFRRLQSPEQRGRALK